MRSGIAVTAYVFFLLSFPAEAQKSRLVMPLDPGHKIPLKDNVNPRATARFDSGPVEGTYAMSYMTLVFAPSDEQRTALDTLLEEQQDTRSPLYHSWLTPQQYADRFGLSRPDLAQAESWLRTEGFTVIGAAGGRDWVSFRGTAAQVKHTFVTEIHRYTTGGKVHIANASAPLLPAALAPMVSGILGMDDFFAEPGRQLQPQNNSGSGHTLAPDDLATIYNLTPLYNAGFDGTGQTIAIAGQSNIHLSDIQAFRKQYNLPPRDPQLVLALGVPDPGFVPGGQTEANLDVEWAGAIARNADIIYVYSKSIFLSLLYAVDLNVAPVVSFSASICEPLAGTNPIYRQTAQRASSQGITWVASSGDEGAASCDSGVASASNGLAVSAIAALPEVTGVGGTAFSDTGGKYWNTVNSPAGASALSYIPEQAWNETSARRGLAASGGGISTLFAKPLWQVGPGVPAGNFRAVPDVSLAAAGSIPYLYVVNGFTSVTAGTSASAPVFAGLVALINQYQIAKGFQKQPGLGNINPVLYRLSQSVPGAFHDIPAGNNIVRA